MAAELAAGIAAGRGTLTTVMLGGEPMPPSLIRTWVALGVRLINTYGTSAWHAGD